MMSELDLNTPGATARGSFREELDHWRSLARSEWQVRAAMARRQDPRIAESLTGYFLDRFAFRLFWGKHRGLEIADRFTQDLEELSRSWESRHLKLLHGVPSLGIAPSDFHAPIPESALLSELLWRWRSFLTERGLPRIEGQFQNPGGQRWGEFYLDSVLYPFYTPVHAGPGFYARLSPAQQSEVLRRHGIPGVTALYAFLARSHEETHRVQFGEPLLCEYLLAWLWCRFLNQEELWYWQRNDQTGESFNIEAPWVLRVELSRDEVIALFTDTQVGITAVCGPRAYEDLCLAAWLFDGKALRYREYLDVVTGYFEHRADPSWQEGARERLEARLLLSPRVRRTAD
ncbi:hypothetical protein POL68_17460 [Stigmatella sp. ncwal1]|uniref:Uncharacterized protein n=1 Tax=Stigmatella ashevillensis TaxID=2995309 RepID=A0ABT5D9E5_9BACT|nr:hypothetical protein [Stigmatella ashevillena]MDC0710269.1 hypothetical protein [Stigmatella ashevillena]